MSDLDNGSRRAVSEPRSPMRTKTTLISVWTRDLATHPSSGFSSGFSVTRMDLRFAEPGESLPISATWNRSIAVGPPVRPTSDPGTNTMSPTPSFIEPNVAVVLSGRPPAGSISHGQQAEAIRQAENSGGANESGASLRTDKMPTALERTDSPIL